MGNAEHAASLDRRSFDFLTTSACEGIPTGVCLAIVDTESEELLGNVRVLMGELRHVEAVGSLQRNEFGVYFPVIVWPAGKSEEVRAALLKFRGVRKVVILKAVP